VRDCLQNLQSDRAIDPHTADANAQSRAHMGIIAAALIAMSVAFPHAVEDTHHSSAPTAPHQTGEQCAAATRRFARAVLLHMRVLKQELLIVLIFLPADVARMIVAQQDIPFISGLREAASLARAPIDNSCSLCSPAKGISARIQWIVKDLHDAVIGRRLPDELADVDIAQDDGHFDVGRPQP
jgi:hypothetical protein